MSQLPENIGLVACYLRRSREDLEAEKRGEDTLLAQRELIEKDILPRFHIDEYDMFQEVVSGESIKDRPEFRKLLDLLQKGRYRAIVVKDLYRLGRGNYSDMGTVYDLLRDKRIYIVTRENILDPNNHDDLRNIRFSMFLSREEYEAIVWRLVNGKYDKARNRGSWVAGSTPFGYDYDRQTRKLVKNKDSETIKMIFNWYIEGLGYGVIATKLRKMQFLTPKGKEYWSPMQIKRILSNEAYIGTVKFRLTRKQKTDGKVVVRPKNEHIVYENAHNPIIDQTTWELAQKRLNRPTPKVNIDFSPNALASLVVCADCNKKMLRQVSIQHYKRKKDNIESVYKKLYLVCLKCRHYVKYETVETQIITYLKELAELDGVLLSDTIRKIMPNEREYDLKGSLERILEKQGVLTNRLKNLKNKWYDGKIDDNEYELDRNEIQKEIDEIGKSVEFIKNQIENPYEKKTNIDIERIKNKFNTVIELYESLEDKAKKNELLLGIFDKVELVFLGRNGKGRSNAFDLNISLNAIFLEN